MDLAYLQAAAILESIGADHGGVGCQGAAYGCPRVGETADHVLVILRLARQLAACDGLQFLELIVAQLTAAHERRAIRIGGELRYHHDAPVRSVKPPPLPSKVDETGEILRIPWIGVVPDVDTSVLQQPVYQLYCPVERRGVLGRAIASPVAPTPLVIALQSVERNLDLPDLVAGNEGTNVFRQ
jgi:hypothetical protein